MRFEQSAGMQAEDDGELHPPGSTDPVGSSGAAGPSSAGARPAAQDRRRFPRIQLALTVELRFSSADAVLESSTVDISEGGVFIRMPSPRPEGTPIKLRLHVGDRALEIGGVVVRSVRPGEGEPPGIGVLFTALRPDDANFVQTLVREQMSPRARSSGER